MGRSWAYIKRKHGEVFEASKTLDWQQPLADVVKGQVRVWRGVPDYAGDQIRTGDLVTTDPASAWAYSNRRGKLLEADIPTTALTYHQRTGNEVEFKYIGKEAAGERVHPQGTIDRYAGE